MNNRNGKRGNKIIDRNIKTLAEIAEIQKRNEAKVNKYRNKRVTVDGMTFDSKHEARIYGELKLLRFKGDIEHIKTQVPYRIEYNGQLICTYVADFVVKYKNGAESVIDAKGVKTQAYRLKKKLMKIINGIDIVEK